MKQVRIRRSPRRNGGDGRHEPEPSFLPTTSRPDTSRATDVLARIDRILERR